LKKEFRSFKEAKKFTQTLKFRNQADWRTYAKSGKLPDHIPRDPPSVYKNEWKGWSDFFGNESRYLKDPPTIEEYKKWLQKIGIKSQTEFRKLPKSKLPKNYPKDPNNHYGKHGTWISWGDLLGTGNVAYQNRVYLSWKEAKVQYRKISKENNIHSLEEWLVFIKNNKLQSNLPKFPKDAYTKSKVIKRRKL